MKRELKIVRGSEATDGLGRDTIMDRVLAAEFGVAYVHMACFAIDMDRIHELEDPYSEWPNAWEVFLTQLYLLESVDPETENEMVTEVIDTLQSLDRGENPLGAQLAFAIYDLAHREIWPSALIQYFRKWKNPPTGLLEDLSALRTLAAEAGQARLLEPSATETALVPDLIGACLEAPLEPPLAPPTRAALEAFLS